MCACWMTHTFPALTAECTWLIFRLKVMWACNPPLNRWSSSSSILFICRVCSVWLSELIHFGLFALHLPGISCQSNSVGGVMMCFSFSSVFFFFFFSKSVDEVFRSVSVHILSSNPFHIMCWHRRHTSLCTSRGDIRISSITHAGCWAWQQSFSCYLGDVWLRWFVCLLGGYRWYGNCEKCLLICANTRNYACSKLNNVVISCCCV